MTMLRALLFAVPPEVRVRKSLVRKVPIPNDTVGKNAAHEIEKEGALTCQPQPIRMSFEVDGLFHIKCIRKNHHLAGRINAERLVDLLRASCEGVGVTRILTNAGPTECACFVLEQGLKEVGYMKGEGITTEQDIPGKRARSRMYPSELRAEFSDTHLPTNPSQWRWHFRTLGGQRSTYN